MQIVIDIDEDVFTRLFDNGIQDNEIAVDDVCEMARALRLGRPLEAQPCEDCISREAVIEHICEAKECYKEECKGRTLERCPDLQWVFDLPSVTPQQTRWIPVSERLPEIHQDILMSLRSLDVVVGFRAKEEPYFYSRSVDGCYIKPQNVLAWKPLPQPYKECDKE